jgi:DNA-binding MarR family transcriptional regulator
LLRRLRSKKDRRVVLLSLTRRGRQIAARAPDAAQGKLLHGLLQMRPNEVRSIRRAVTRMVSAMEAEDVESTFFFSGE